MVNYIDPNVWVMTKWWRQLVRALDAHGSPLGIHNRVMHQESLWSRIVLVRSNPVIWHQILMSGRQKCTRISSWASKPIQQTKIPSNLWSVKILFTIRKNAKPLTISRIIQKYYILFQVLSHLPAKAFACMDHGPHTCTENTMNVTK